MCIDRGRLFLFNSRSFPNVSDTPPSSTKPDAPGSPSVPVKLPPSSFLPSQFPRLWQTLPPHPGRSNPHLLHLLEELLCPRAGQIPGRCHTRRGCSRGSRTPETPSRGFPDSGGAFATKVSCLARTGHACCWHPCGGCACRPQTAIAGVPGRQAAFSGIEARARGSGRSRQADASGDDQAAAGTCTRDRHAETGRISRPDAEKPDADAKPAEAKPLAAVSKIAEPSVPETAAVIQVGGVSSEVPLPSLPGRRRAGSCSPRHPDLDIPFLNTKITTNRHRSWPLITSLN